AAGAEVVVERELVVRLAQVEGADVADRHQRVAAGGLGVREDPGVEVEVVVRLGLVDVAGAAARDGLELDQLIPDLRRQRTGGDVELLRGQGREASLVVGDLLHVVVTPECGVPHRTTENDRCGTPHSLMTSGVRRLTTRLFQLCVVRRLTGPLRARWAGTAVGPNRARRTVCGPPSCRGGARARRAPSPPARCRARRHGPAS